MEKVYGNYGWKEILRTRKDLIDEYIKAKEYNQNRPVRTSHGNTAEASFRKWLLQFLPKKYGITSGYIIPDLIAKHYELLHYDVIIYDNLNSPVLWIESNDDQSEQGKFRAIPANHIKAIFEIKSAFNYKNINKAIKKLKEINKYIDYLPNNFFCGIIFFELSPSLMKQEKLLLNLLPDPPIFNFYGGLLLYCELNINMTGLINIYSPDENVPKDVIDTQPIVKDIDTLDIDRNADGKPYIGGQNEGLRLYSDGNKWHMSKFYCKSKFKDNLAIDLMWSYNSFSIFITDLLSNLEGRPFKNQELIRFGMCFDEI